MTQASDGPSLHVDKVANYRDSGMNWVGGRLRVSDTQLEFHPNGANRKVVGDHDVVVPLADVRGVRLQRGLVTSKVCVEAVEGEVVFRCWGAKGVVETLERLRPRT